MASLTLAIVIVFLYWLFIYSHRECYKSEQGSCCFADVCGLLDTVYAGS